MHNLLIVGDGGHGKVVFDTAQQSKKYNKIAFLVNYDSIYKIDGIEYYKENEISYKRLLKEFSNIIVAIGDNKIRLEKSLMLKRIGFNLETVIHPYSYVSKYAKIEEGCFIGANSVINAFAKVGKACIINTGSIVEHECVLGEGVHLSPNVSMGGQTRIGDLTWVCIGSCIAHKICIGKKVVIAAGSCVIKNVEDSVMVAGVPGHIVNSTKNSKINQ